MSFYGNTYYYGAESFATIVLANSGIGKYITTPELNDIFKTLSKDEKVTLKAQYRDSGLGIESGNHWISLARSGDKFQIWHNAPAKDGEINSTFNFEIDTDPPAGIDEIAEVLDFNTVIKVPSVNYDKAGHVIETSESRYFKMPQNPKDVLNEDLTVINNDIENIEKILKKEIAIDIPYDFEGKKSSETTNGRLEAVEKKLTNFNSDVEKVDTIAKDFSEFQSTVRELKGDVKNLKSQVDNLLMKQGEILTRLTDLENNGNT